VTPSRSPVEWLLVAIAVITTVSGLLQLVAPDAALAIMDVTPASETVYFFRIVSLLTALFGGALLHTSWRRRYEATVLLWAGLQKVLGAAAVVLAVLSATLSGNTLLVAGYDFLAGLFVLWFWSRRDKTL
jgi:predicted phage tail protein